MQAVPLDDPDRLVTREVAAELLCVTVATIDDWAYRHVGPPRVKLGGRCVRYRLGDLREHIARCRVVHSATAEAQR
jgi:predicted DNA-binding transcriptional regulator AlpA